MISVLMLTYNREKLLSRAIESVLTQTYTDFEYIIIDNGSTDRSGNIAEDYAKKDERIQVIHSGGGTIGHGRNLALDAAKGDYIAFLDDDDWLEPDYLEFLLDLIIKNNADMSICGRTDRAFDEQKIMNAEEALIEMMWRKKYTVAFNAKMFKRILVEKQRFPEDVFIDDIALMYKVIADAKCVVYHGLPKYHLYRHEGNTSAWTTNQKLLHPNILDEYLKAYKTRTQYLSKRFPNSAEKFQYFEWSFMISMIEKINRLEINDCRHQLECMISGLQKHDKEFLQCPQLQDFEREWMEKYILGGIASEKL